MPQKELATENTICEYYSDNNNKDVIGAGLTICTRNCFVTIVAITSTSLSTQGVVL